MCRYFSCSIIIAQPRPLRGTISDRFLAHDSAWPATVALLRTLPQDSLIHSLFSQLFSLSPVVFALLPSSRLCSISDLATCVLYSGCTDMEPPVRTREQHSRVEQEFLAVCRQFLLHAIPVDVMPPGRTVQYKSKKFINHTDYWLTLPRILSHSGHCLTRTEQSRHIRDRTGEMMRTVLKMLSLLESLLVSSWDLGRECESREQTVTSVLKEYLEEQCVGVRVRDRFPEVTWMHEYPSQLDTRKMHDLYTCMRQAQDHIAYMKTFEDGLKICMICGYDFWSAIWEDR